MEEIQTEIQHLPGKPPMLIVHHDGQRTEYEYCGKIERVIVLTYQELCEQYPHWVAEVDRGAEQLRQWKDSGKVPPGPVSAISR